VLKGTRLDYVRGKRAALEKKLVDVGSTFYLEVGTRTRIETLRQRRMFRGERSSTIRGEEEIVSDGLRRGECLPRHFSQASENRFGMRCGRASDALSDYGVNEERNAGAGRVIYTEPALYGKEVRLVPGLRRRWILWCSDGWAGLPMRGSTQCNCAGALAAHDVGAEAWAVAGGRSKRYRRW